MAHGVQYQRTQATDIVTMYSGGIWQDTCDKHADERKFLCYMYAHSTRHGTN